MAGAREVILRTVEQSNAEEKTDWSVIKEKIRVDLKRYLKKQTSKRPTDSAGDPRIVRPTFFVKLCHWQTQPRFPGHEMHAPRQRRFGLSLLYEDFAFS